MVDDKTEPTGQEKLISTTENLPYKTYKVVHKENALSEDYALLWPHNTRTVENGRERSYFVNFNISFSAVLHKCSLNMLNMSAFS